MYIHLETENENLTLTLRRELQCQYVGRSSYRLYVTGEHYYLQVIKYITIANKNTTK